jgi:hypothetical protein
MGLSMILYSMNRSITYDKLMQLNVEWIYVLERGHSDEASILMSCWRKKGRHPSVGAHDSTYR